MNRQQLKAVAQFNKAREAYLQYAFSVRWHVSNEHKTAKALDAAGDSLIIACYGDDPWYREHSKRCDFLKFAAEKLGVDIYFS